MKCNALIAFKDVLSITRAPWVSVMDAFKVALVNALGNLFSCRHLVNQFHEITICSAAEVMIKNYNLLYAKLTNRLFWIRFLVISVKKENKSANYVFKNSHTTIYIDFNITILVL